MPANTPGRGPQSVAARCHVSLTSARLQEGEAKACPVAPLEIVFLTLHIVHDPCQLLVTAVALLGRTTSCTILSSRRRTSLLAEMAPVWTNRCSATAWMTVPTALMRTPAVSVQFFFITSIFKLLPHCVAPLPEKRRATPLFTDVLHDFLMPHCATVSVSFCQFIQLAMLFLFTLLSN